MQLFYNSDLTSDTKEFTFDKNESRHIVRVLRKQEGDVLHLTNGKGFLFTCEVIVANDKKCLTRVTHSEEKVKPWNYYLHIAIAPTKNNDRYEWFLEKATEIGIDEITPIICQNSERKVLKNDRMEKILQSAMKQSLKFRLPKLNKPIKFSEFIHNSQNGKLCITHCEEQNKTSLKEHIFPKEDVTLLIGPEGDFSLQEIQTALNKNYQPITLGESRLRTETAGIVATQSIYFINQ